MTDTYGNFIHIGILISLWSQKTDICARLRELLSPRVIYGKDRQDDNSSFSLCSSDVLDTLKVYNRSSLSIVHRFPETLFSHKKDALNHHEIKAISSFIWHSRLELFYIADSSISSIWVCKNSSIMKL